eukprot:gene5141-5507_t
MSSQLPKPFAEATPNSSQLAEILLQLKEDDGITRLVQNHNNGFSLSQQTVRDDYEDDEVSNNGVNEVPTLSASEACNCRKSKCLKLYCQCFAGQAVCGQFCRCVDCENRSPSSLTRMVAIKNVLERNPNAFESKYKATTVVNEDDELAAAVAHKNGCRCRKSHCLKKYCECFQGSVHCSIICTCVDCHNREGVPPPLASTRSLPQTATEKHKVFSFALDSSLTANFPDTQVTARALQGLKRNYSESDTAQTDSPPTKASPTNTTVKREEFTRQFSLNSDPGVGSASKPPLVPLIKRRKMEHNGTGMATGGVAAPAASSSGSGIVPPSTPATGTGVTLNKLEDDDMDHDHHPRRNSSPSSSLPSNILLSPNSSIVIHVE